MDRDATRPGRNHLTRAPRLWEGNTNTGFGARGNREHWETLWQRALPAPPLPRVLFSEERAEILSWGEAEITAPTQKMGTAPSHMREWPFPLDRSNAETEQFPGNTAHPRRKCLLMPQPWGEVSPKSCPVTRQPLGVAPGASSVALRA